jgi:hypothetical protein
VQVKAAVRVLKLLYQGFVVLLAVAAEGTGGGWFGAREDEPALAALPLNGGRLFQQGAALKFRQ